MHLGIYSGAFDPIHDGHVQFALEAIAQAKLDRVYFLIEPSPRHKQGVKAFEHRVAMVRLAIQDEPSLGLIELKQARFYVHETWPVLQRRFEGAQLSMLMGSDVFAKLSHWPRVDELLTSAQLVVGVRQGQRQDFKEHLTMIETERKLTLRYTMFNSLLPTESSSHIRRTLRKGKVPDGMNQAVLNYIQEQQLYSSTFSE